MKPSVFCAFILILAFAVVMVSQTFFPTHMGTVEQQHNALYAGVACACAGVVLMMYSKKRGYKIL